VTGGHKVFGDEAADFQTSMFRFTILTELPRIQVRAGPVARFMRPGF
jgi:hypothetical protein